jgi:DNA-binding SARP family transcriptional activator/tetratricopeptide (TPR) repeat protein
VTASPEAPRFQILGPVRGWRGERELALGSAQRRTVLAALLLSRDRPLGRDGLIDAVWGSAAPAYAVNLVQKHVSALRHLLEPDLPRGAPPTILAWKNSAYALVVPMANLDLGRFETEVALARDAAATGDLPTAAATFRTALGRWHGALCQGLSGPLIDAERDRLAEQQLASVEDWIETELALGQHDGLAGELRYLTRRHPFRERLRGQLMLALYRSGRQADAQQVYRETRDWLRDELGSEPTEQLRLLHQRILAADPGLLPTHDTAPAANAPAHVGRRARSPAQLPRPIPGFTGRIWELASLDAALAREGAVVALSGTAGVGKSSLAVHWAHRVREQFPDGQLYINLRGFDTGDTAMGHDEAFRTLFSAILPESDRVPPGFAAQANLYRSLLADRRILVLLDNARDPAQVRPLLPGSPGCVTVITSRDVLSGLVASDAATLVVLETFTDAEADEFLTRRLGSARTQAEPSAVAEIGRLCARLPLALAIVASRAATGLRLTLADIAAELRKRHGSLDSFAGTDPTTDARRVFSWSYRALDPETARLFRYLGLHPGPDIDTVAAASLAGRPVESARRLLAALSAAQLIQERAPGRYSVHDLLRAYTAELTVQHDPEPDRHAAMHRVRQSYLHSAHRADVLLEPRRGATPPGGPGDKVSLADLSDRAQAIAWFTAEQRNLVAVIEHAADESIWQLTSTLTYFFDRHGSWHDLERIHRAALAAARHGSDQRGQASSYRGLARACIRLGRYDEAARYLDRAVRAFESIGDRSSLARTALDEAWLLELQGRESEALAPCRRSLELFRAAEDRDGEAYALNSVGWAYGLIGDYQQELDFCRAALAMLQKLGDLRGEADTWDSLGHALHRMHDHSGAVSCYENSLAYYRELGDRYGEATALAKAGAVHRDAGDADSAIAAWSLAMSILDELGHADAQRVRLDLLQVSESAQ